MNKTFTVRLHPPARDERHMNADEFVECADAHHGTGNSVRGVVFSCQFSFRVRRGVSQEYRNDLLRLLYDSMTARVDDALRVESSE